MPAIEHPALLRLMLEEMLPGCVVEGLADYTNPEVMKNEKPVPEPTLMTPPDWLVKQIKEPEPECDFSRYFTHLHGEKDKDEIRQVRDNMAIDAKTTR